MRISNCLLITFLLILYAGSKRKRWRTHEHDGDEDAARVVGGPGEHGNQGEVNADGDHRAGRAVVDDALGEAGQQR